MREPSLSVAGALLLALAAPAAGGELEKMAEAAEKQARVAMPLRADVEAEIDGVEGKKAERLVMLFRTSPKGGGVETWVEVGKARYLVLPDGTAHAAENGEAKAVPLDTPIDGTSWTLEDLLPFSIDRCGFPRTVEVMPAYMTVLCDPKPEHRGQYVLWVYKFDRAKAVAERVLYYQERQDNLVKMLRSSEFAEIGGKWRPARMVMQNYKLRTRDVFRVSWSESPAIAQQIFDPAAFAKAEPPAKAAPAE